jgi:hypothetical protein
MSWQAEAERERRARIISADGEYQAFKKLAQAATVMAADPAALQLRLLQTVVEVAAEKNSTLVMPVPVELLRFFDRAAPATGQAQPRRRRPGRRRPPTVPEIPALTTPASLPASAASTAPLNAAPKHQPPSERHRARSQPRGPIAQASKLLADAHRKPAAAGTGSRAWSTVSGMVSSSRFGGGMGSRPPPGALTPRRGPLGSGA